MSKPTCRELLDWADRVVPGDEPWDELAARVERVLALQRPSAKGHPPQWRAGWNAALYEVDRILNGEEP